MLIISPKFSFKLSRQRVKSLKSGHLTKQDIRNGPMGVQTSTLHQEYITEWLMSKYSNASKHAIKLSL